MSISEAGLIVIIIADTAVSLFVGALVGRILTRYPFGVSGFTGSEGMIGRKCTVTSISRDRIEVSVDSQIWAAYSHDKDSIQIGDKCIVKDVDGLTLIIQKIHR